MIRPVRTFFSIFSAKKFAETKNIPYFCIRNPKD